MALNAFDIIILILSLIVIPILMNMFKISDRLARCIVKKSEEP